jgi:hypothetical protein
LESRPPSAARNNLEFLFEHFPLQRWSVPPHSPLDSLDEDIPPCPPGGWRLPLRAQDTVIVIDPDAVTADTTDRQGLPDELIQRLLAVYNDSTTTRFWGDVGPHPGIPAHRDHRCLSRLGAAGGKPSTVR